MFATALAVGAGAVVVLLAVGAGAVVVLLDVGAAAVAVAVLTVIEKVLMP